MPRAVFPVAALALLVAGCATTADPISVDELTKNGRLVAGVELRKLFTQATVEGKDPNGVEFTLRTDDEGNYRRHHARRFVRGAVEHQRPWDVCFDTRIRHDPYACSAQYC